MEDFSFDIEYFSKRIGKLREELVEEYPNLNSEDCLRLMYVLLGYMVGNGFYAHLEITLDDKGCLKDLEGLSNGYFEFDGKTLNMGVTDHKNFEKILHSPNIKPKSIKILKR